MANEFIIKKGLVVKGASGGTVVNVLGSQGQLLSVTDNLSGSIFAVSDISGVPIFDVNSSGLVNADGPFSQTGGGSTTLSGTLNVAGVSTLANVGYLGDGLGSVQYTLQSANNGYGTIDFGDVADSNIGRLSYNHNDNSFLIRTNNLTALTLDSGQNATFAGTITSGALTVGASGTSRFTDTSALPLQLNRGLAVDVYGTNGVVLGLGSYTTGTTYVDAARIAANLEYDGTTASGDLFLQVNNSGTYTNALTINNDTNATFAGKAYGVTPQTADLTSMLATKGYVNQQISGGANYLGTWDPDNSLNSGYGNPNLQASGRTDTSGDYFICSADGGAHPNGGACEPDSWAVGDWVVWNSEIEDCAGTGTGTWQKVDNTSVLSGIGTGQTVALWEGDSSVADSETLGNAPITVSGDDATFAGAGAFAGTLSAPFVTASNPNGAANGSPQEVARFVNVNSGATSAYMYIGASSGTDWRLGKNINGTTSNSNFGITKHSGTILAMEIDGSLNTTFSGNGTFGGSGNFGGSVNIGSGGDLILTASSGSTDTGDIVFYHTAAEAHRLWSGTNTLNYRTDGGTTYYMLHSGNYTDYNAYTTLSAATRSAGDNTANVATTEFVTAAVAAGVGNYVTLTTAQTISGVKTFTGTAKFEKSNNQISIVDSDDSQDFRVQVNGGQFSVRDHTNSDTSFKIDANIGSDRLLLSSAGATFAGTIAVQGTGDSYFQGNVGIGTTSPSVPLAVEGVASMGSNSRLSMGILDINSSATPTQILIQTTIPFNSGSADFTVNIKGFVYGTDESCNLSIHWHYYNSVPYNANITSSGSWAPIANLHSSSSGFIQIHLLSPGYWPKLYVESMYSSAYNDIYASGWSWSDAAGTGTAYALDYNKDFGNNFVMTDPGNVGIGTANPDTKLHVKNESAGDAMLTIQSTSAGDPGITMVTTNDRLGNIFYRDGSASSTSRLFSYDHAAQAFKMYAHNQTTPDFYVSETTAYFPQQNVGIGVTGPAAKLHVDSSTAFSLTSVAGDTLFLSDDTSGSSLNGVGASIGFSGPQAVQRQAAISALRTGSNHDHIGLAFYTHPSTSNDETIVEQMRITDSGNVGIGTSTPLAKLDIQGTQGQLFSVTDDLSGSIFAVADISGVPIFDVNSSGIIKFNSYDSSNQIGTPTYILGTDASGTVVKTLSGGGQGGSPWLLNASNRIYNTNSGNVGIGETNPQRQLHVNSGTTNVVARFESTDTTAAIEFKDNNGSAEIGNTGDNLVFFPAGAEKMRITSGGQVGIGITTNTTIPLHVNTTSSSTVIKAQGIAATIEIESGTAGNATLYQRPNTTGDKEAEFRCTLGSTYGWSWKDDNATSTSRIKYMKLDQNPGTLTVKGDVVAYGSPSDRSLKENIKPIDSALDKVMKLQGVTFDWKQKEDVILDIKEDIGFIAQDVQKVVPELIRENSNGLLSMRHQGVAPILLEAIKELKAEIDLLKSKPCTCNKCNCNI